MGRARDTTMLENMYLLDMPCSHTPNGTNYQKPSQHQRKVTISSYNAEIRQYAHQHICSMCCRAEVQAVIASIHNNIAQCASVLWVQLVRCPHLHCVLQACSGAAVLAELETQLEWICENLAYPNVTHISGVTFPGTYMYISECL